MTGEMEFGPFTFADMAKGSFSIGSAGIAEQLLDDLRQIFQHSQSPRVPTRFLITELAGRDPWREWNGRDARLTERQLAGLLRPYHIHPKPIRFRQRIMRGYSKRQCIHIWSQERR